MIFSALMCWQALVVMVSLLLLQSRARSRQEAVNRRVEGLKTSPKEAISPSSTGGQHALSLLTGRKRLMGAIYITLPALLILALSGTWWSLLVALPPGFLIPRLVKRFQEEKRRRLIRTQLYDFLDAMIQSLEGGFSVFQALEFSADDVAPPLRVELQKTVADLRYGTELEEALGRLRKTVAETEFDSMVEMLLLLKQSGGNLPLLLRKLRVMMRDRAEVARDIRVYTTQGRWSGYVVSALPVAFLGIESVFSPSLIQPLFATPLGLALLASGLAMDAAGFLCVRRISSLGRDARWRS